MYAECKVLIFRARTVIVIRHIQNVCDRAGSSALLTFRWSCLLLHQDKLNESTHRLLLVAHSQSENYVSWIYHGIAVANKYHWMALPYHSQDQSMHNKTNARIQRARKTMKKTSEMNIKLYNFVCIYCLKLSIHRKIERERAPLVMFGVISLAHVRNIHSNWYIFLMTLFEKQRIFTMAISFHVRIREKITTYKICQNGIIVNHFWLKLSIRYKRRCACIHHAVPTCVIVLWWRSCVLL